MFFGRSKETAKPAPAATNLQNEISDNITNHKPQLNNSSSPKDIILADGNINQEDIPLSLPNENEQEQDDAIVQFEMEEDEEELPDDDTIADNRSEVSDTSIAFSVDTYSNRSISPNPSSRVAAGGKGSNAAISDRAAARRSSLFSSVFGRSSTYTTNTEAANSSSHSDSALWRIQSPELVNIGKGIRAIEAEIKKDIDVAQRHWKANERPLIEKDISALEKQVAFTMVQISKEAKLGSEHVYSLEDVLKELNTNLDIKKRKLYFPDSLQTFGSSGIYFGLDAFWLQFASGHFILNLSPDRQMQTNPFISLLLAGTSKNPSAGVTVKCKLEGFKLRGDKGTKVPTLNFESLKLQVAVTLTMRVVYDYFKQKWTLASKDFNLKILSFKGPYGLNRTMVSMILSFVTPIIRSQLVQALPYELGVFIQSLPSPFCMKGEFDLHGIDLNVLQSDFAKSEVFAELTEYSKAQLEMFIGMQRSMERSSILRSISDVISYQRKHKSYADKWALLLQMWRDACMIYSETIASSKMDQLMQLTVDEAEFNPYDYTINFDTILRACDDIEHKRTAADCKLQYIDGQISLNMFLSFIFQVQYRLASEQQEKASGISKVRLQAYLDIVQKQYDLSVAVLGLLCQNVDFAHLTILGELHSGAQGEAQFKVTDMLSQAPMMVNLSIQTDKNIGLLPLVPYMLSLQPQVNGDVCIELYHFNQEMVNPESNKDENTIGKYSTHYNKVLNKVNENRKKGMARYNNSNHNNANNNYNNAAASAAAGTLKNLHPIYQKVNQIVKRASTNQQGIPHSASSNSLEDHPMKVDEMFPTAHLIVRQHDLDSSLKWTLQDYPKNEESDTIMVVVATNPHLSVIVDKPVKLLAGTELFTFVMGPKVKDWQPLGKAFLLDPENDFKPSNDKKPESLTEKYSTNQSMKASKRVSLLRTKPLEEVLASADITKAATIITGCPIKIQTAPGIKMLFQVSQAFVNVNTSGLFRFLLAHFTDVKLLKEYLEIFLGGVFIEEQLLVIKRIIEKVAKYLMLPGIDIDLNINFRVITLNGEFMIRIETPESQDQLEFDMVQTENLTRESKKVQVYEGPSAVNLRADFSATEVVKDTLEFIAYAARLFEITTLITASDGDNTATAGAQANPHPPTTSTPTNVSSPSSIVNRIIGGNTTKAVAISKSVIRTNQQNVAMINTDTSVITLDESEYVTDTHHNSSDTSNTVSANSPSPNSSSTGKSNSVTAASGSMFRSMTSGMSEIKGMIRSISPKPPSTSTTSKTVTFSSNSPNNSPIVEIQSPIPSNTSSSVSSSAILPDIADT